MKTDMATMGNDRKAASVPPFKKKIKVLFVLRMIGFGGAERQVVELCSGMNKDRFDITVALFFHDDGFLEQLNASGVKVRILSTKSQYKSSVIFQLIRLMKEEQFDILQTMLPIANLAGGIAARFSTRPQVVGSLRNTNPFSWLDPFCLMDLVALNLFSDRVVVNSQAGKQSALKKYGLRNDKVTVIYNGKDFSPYVNKSAGIDRLRKELHIPGDHKVVTTIGRIAKQKGHRYLVEAAHILVRQKNQKMTFLLAGKAEESFAEIQSLIKEYSLESNVRLLGLRNDIADILHLSDVFVLPSLWEGLPNVLLEAMIAKVPVVATDIEPHREVIEHHKTGLLVPPQDSAVLADAIMEIINNPQKAYLRQEAAYRHVSEKFSREQLVKEYEEFYQNLCRR